MCTCRTFSLYACVLKYLFQVFEVVDGVSWFHLCFQLKVVYKYGVPAGIHSTPDICVQVVTNHN